MPGPTFDYIDGGADSEVTLRRNNQPFEDVDLVPNTLQDVSDVDLSVSAMRQKLALPIHLSRTALHRLFHHPGERAAAADAAEKFGSVFGCSSPGTVWMEGLAKAERAASVKTKPRGRKTPVGDIRTAASSYSFRSVPALQMNGS
nr:alpha-hydroxy-acid oxidizing protein [Paracoccus marinus]